MLLDSSPSPSLFLVRRSPSGRAALRAVDPCAVVVAEGVLLAVGAVDSSLVVDSNLAADAAGLAASVVEAQAVARSAAAEELPEAVDSVDEDAVDVTPSA